MKNKTVLMAISNRQVEEALIPLLSQNNFTLLSTQTFNQAIASLSDNFPDIGLISPDLPGGEGIELHKKIRESNPFSLVIALLERWDSGRALSFIQSGAYQCLAEPVSPEVIISYINMASSVIDRRRVMIEELTKGETDTMFDNAPLAFQSLDANGDILRVNSTWLDILGYKENEVIKHNFTEFLFKEYVGKFISLFPLFLKIGKIDNVEMKLRKKDGNVIDVNYNCSAFYDAQGRFSHTYCIFQDVTSQKQAEAALRENEEKYRLFFENSLVGTYRTKIDGTIIDCSDSFAEMLGYESRDEVKKINAKELYFKNDDRWGFIADISEKNYLPNNELVLKKKTGEPLWIIESASLLRDQEGQIREIQGSMIDITERKRTEAELEAIFDMSLDMICVVDLNTATFLKINPSFTRILGYTEEELLGKPFLDFIHPDDVKSTIAVIDEELKKGKIVVNFINRYRCKDGSYKIFDWNSHPAPEEGKTYAIAHDITEQHRAEIALKESEERFKQLFNQLHNGAVICQTVDGGKNFIFKDANRAAQQGDFRRKEQVIGKLVTDIVPDFEKLGMLAAMQRVYRTGESEDLPIKIYQDGKIKRWVENHIYKLPSGEIAAIYQDTSLQRQAEAALRESQRELATLMGNLPGMAYRCRNDRDWTVHFVSEGCMELTGYKQIELIENRKVSYGSIIHTDDREKVWQEVQQALEAKQAFQMEYRILTADGKEKWVWEKGIGIFNEHGELQYLEGFITDITGRKTAEEERIKLEARVQQTQKMESLSLLAGGVAHDYNNLLQGIIGNAGLALMDLSPDSTAYESVEAIKRSAKHAAELTMQMLAFSGKGSFDVRAFDLSTLAKQMRQLITANISRKINLVYDLKENVPLIVADVTQIRQIVMNLVINASEAIVNKEGTITVSNGKMHCGKDCLSRIISKVDLAEGEYIYLSVKDDGCGIPPELIHKVVDPFFSTKFVGRGLGLAAVLGIVSEYKGGIIINSEKEKGSEFITIFPISQNNAAQIIEEKIKKVEWKGSGLVLLTDDEEAVRKVSERMLLKMGFQVLTAANGLEAVKIFKENQDKIRLVILDYTMPVLSGTEAYTHITNIKSDIPVILSSGYNEETAVNKSTSGKNLTFMQKPYEYQSLMEKIREVLEQNIE